MQDNEPYIITKKRTVRKVFWGRIITVIIILSLAAVGAVLWFSRSTGKISVPAGEYWFVSLGEYSDLSEASACAEHAVRSGGAGYLYGNSEYNVALSCYASKSDAETVVKRLSDDGESCGIFSVTCGKLSVDKPKENAELLKKMLMRPARIFDELYGISVKTDTKELSESAAKYAALKMSVACGEYAAECGALRSDAGDYLGGLFASISETLDDLARTQENVPQAFKYALCETAVKICKQSNDFADKLKNVS